MRYYNIKMIFLILAIIASATGAFCETGLTGGLGLTHLEQRFVLFERDTISTGNEGKAFIEGSWEEIIGNNQLRANSSLYTGTESFWGRAKAEHERTGTKNLTIKTDLSVDLRQPYELEDIPGYYKWSMNFRTRKKWDEARGSARFSLEDKSYTSESTYAYDYSLSRIRFDFGFPLIAERDELTFGYQFAFRYAPDTTEANYQRNNVFVSWDYFSGGNYWRADFDGERRVYNKGDLSGNHWRTNWNIAPKIGLTDKLTIEPKLIAESYRYDLASSVYPNRDDISVKTTAEWAFSPYLYGSVGPKYLVSWANLSESDNYREYSMEFGLDWLKYRKIWLDLIVEPGFRVYEGEIPEEFAFYSNFWFVEISAISSYWITERLRVDLIGIYSPEWHDIDDNDITTLYLSTNLKYEFFKSK